MNLQESTALSTRRCNNAAAIQCDANAADKINSRPHSSDATPSCHVKLLFDVYCQLPLEVASLDLLLKDPARERYSKSMATIATLEGPFVSACDPAIAESLLYATAIF
jgi:hypothetical protein